jgi:hypothetical protein
LCTVINHHIVNFSLLFPAQAIFKYLTVSGLSVSN